MSALYWETRYDDGGNSGDGSDGESALFKAKFVNALVRDQDIRSVVEFGCGDGRQLLLADYPNYIGLDVSESALQLCRRLFADDLSKQFLLLPYLGPRCELGLSLDVVYHLIEDEVYKEHLYNLFQSASRFVALYTTDMDEDPISADHVRHRRVSSYIREWFSWWRLVEKKPGVEGSRCFFLVYAR